VRRDFERKRGFGRHKHYLNVGCQNLLGRSETAAE
jgi:hypothetical protein